jgi:hypothetical protein
MNQIVAYTLSQKFNFAEHVTHDTTFAQAVTVELVDFTTYAPNSRKILTRAELDQKGHWQGLTRVCDGSIANRWYALSASCTVYQKPITTTRYSIATLTLYCDLTACHFFLFSAWFKLETTRDSFYRRSASGPVLGDHIYAYYHNVADGYQ